ncbi:MAG: TerC family protein [Flavobacteriaceae bacterium]|nr:TerC family protein [Flavobacteriaceae bacterium]
MDFLFTPEAIVAFLTLTFLEIVLGIDNIIFISIVTGKLPKEKRKRATRLGLFLAMFMRIAMLIGISYLIAMKVILFEIDWNWFSVKVTGQGVILLLGGLFLIYKSTKEIHEKVTHVQEDTLHTQANIGKSFSNAIVQILVIDLIFSIDSILTAVGMTNGIDGALPIMIAAVVISVLVMLFFAIPIGDFVHKNPTIQILGLSFLILIGFMLITESAHLSHAMVFNSEVGAIPKGYLYFAIAFSLGVEFLNMKLRKKTSAS